MKRAIGMKSALVNFTGRPNSLSTSAKPDIETMCTAFGIDPEKWAQISRYWTTKLTHDGGLFVTYSDRVVVLRDGLISSDDRREAFRAKHEI